MPIALGTLTVGKEPLRYYQVEIVLSAGHRDMEQAALLLDRDFTGAN